MAFCSHFAVRLGSVNADLCAAAERVWGAISQCKYEFCWLCLAPWKEHGEATGGFYACNRCLKAPLCCLFAHPADASGGDSLSPALPEGRALEALGSDRLRCTAYFRRAVQSLQLWGCIAQHSAITMLQVRGRQEGGEVHGGRGEAGACKALAGALHALLPALERERQVSCEGAQLPVCCSNIL